MWEKSPDNEFGILIKVLKRGIQVTESMKFIKKHEVPYNKKVTDEGFFCDYRPQKEERERTRITLGGNMLEYQRGVST